MKNGVELISLERQKQIEKYGFTGNHHSEHPEWYDEGQLVYAANHLSHPYPSDHREYLPPNWDLDWWKDLCQREMKERLVIAGALIAAELDRLMALENKSEINNPKS